MHFHKLIPYLLIVRPGICVGTFILVLVSTWIARDGDFPIVSAVLGAIGISLIAGAGSVINDIFDIQVDRCNNPQRPLPSGTMTEREALGYYFILIVASLLLFWLVNMLAFLIGAGISILLLFYSWKLREISGIASNAVVALSIGTMLAFGAIVTGHFTREIALLFGFGFAVALSREILGDVADIKGDLRQGNLRTLPITWGREKSLLVVLLILLSTTVFSLSPLVMGGVFDYHLLSIGPLLICLWAASTSTWQILREGKVRGAQTTLKATLFVYPLSVAFVCTFR